jgi:uncharacterized protein (DUF1697 family)
MPTYVALLRAVNVGGTGKLAMSRLKSICDDAGFDRVETYIASGNVVFASPAKPAKVKAELEARLAAELGKPVGVVVRTASEMAAVLAANPFAGCEAKHTYAFFLDAAPPRKALDDVKGRNDEEIALGKREIYVHYPSGMGRSKLRIPAASVGTARNMNTVAKLAEMGHGRRMG